ncbi:hypothetical protein OROGR_005662 [Orobanche gracilis]
MAIRSLNCFVFILLVSAVLGNKFFQEVIKDAARPLPTYTCVSILGVCGKTFSEDRCYQLCYDYFNDLNPQPHCDQYPGFDEECLAMSNYSAVDGKLYCKPHFEQLYKETGSKPPPSGKQGELNRAPSKVSSLFSGTQEKCDVCTKTVYPLEKPLDHSEQPSELIVTVEEKFYHKSCFRCAHGGCNLTTSNYAALDGILYCKPHFAQLFKEKGSYTHLTETTTSKKNALAHDTITSNGSEQLDENSTPELTVHDDI